jgi:deoxyribonuclease-4
VGFCLDTCHLLASGYDVASAAGLDETLQKAASVLGLERVPLIHVNDSQGALASRLDRHANIGEGQIGLDGFTRIMNDARLRTKAFVLETPLDDPEDDRRNLDQLRKLCRKSRTVTKKSS